MFEDLGSWQHYQGTARFYNHHFKDRTYQSLSRMRGFTRSISSYNGSKYEQWKAKSINPPDSINLSQ